MMAGGPCSRLELQPKAEFYYWGHFGARLLCGCIWTGGNRGQLMKLQESRTAGGRRHLGWAGKRWNGTEEVSAEDSQTRPTSPAAAVGRGHPSPTLSVALVWYIPSQMPRQPRFWSLLAWLSCLYLSHAVVSKCCCLATCLASGGGNI
jgi:hypothetical protein